MAGSRRIEDGQKTKPVSIAINKMRDPCNRPRQRLWRAGLPMVLVRQGGVNRYHRHHLEDVDRVLTSGLSFTRIAITTGPVFTSGIPRSRGKKKQGSGKKKRKNIQHKGFAGRHRPNY
jgi:hypothetical protein